MDKNLQEVMGCTGLRIRRTTRHVTHIYDRALEAVGLTINQFGVLQTFMVSTACARMDCPSERFWSVWE
jgi:hypothetical protein